MSATITDFVAVIGGLWQLEPVKAEAARAAAGAVGAELAKAGFGLVVYFSDKESLEPHVVSGYCAALSDGNGVIRVRYAQPQRGEVKFEEEETHAEIFEHRLFPGQDWEAPFYRSLAEDNGVDGILLLGGAASTLIAGQIAVARRLPVLAIDQFGGSAAKIWNQLAQASSEGSQSSWGTRPARAFVQQLKDECAARRAKRDEESRRQRIFEAITTQRKQVGHAAGAFVTLLISLFFGMVYTPLPGAYTFIMFLGLVSAGATGALIRLILSKLEQTDPRTSLFLGSVAGFVVGLAYLIPQWIGAPGVLASTESAVTATDKIQFASAVLVAISAGVGFDTVFNRLQKEAQGISVSP
ncbi:hypothetical protein PQQ86_29345 [Paraburkholderia sediminicola]|uniref:hypothetical protein n=1 Tax=Paraburkholderia sediminicola TaxID=458836 RepID=UPI0038B9E88B